MFGYPLNNIFQRLYFPLIYSRPIARGERALRTGEHVEHACTRKRVVGVELVEHARPAQDVPLVEEMHAQHAAGELFQYAHQRAHACRAHAALAVQRLLKVEQMAVESLRIHRIAAKAPQARAVDQLEAVGDGHFL